MQSFVERKEKQLYIYRALFAAMQEYTYTTGLHLINPSK